MTAIVDYKKGIPYTSPVASVVAAATGTLVHDLPTARTGKIRGAHIQNRNAAATLVSFGTGLLGAYVAATPEYQVLAGMELPLHPEDFPDVEFSADITAAATVAAAAPADVRVQIDVEEYIGTSG